MAKYGASRDGWRSCVISEPHGVGLSDIGVGSRISFWKDVWCGESSLNDSLFSII
jgi:hypothetical protein